MQQLFLILYHRFKMQQLFPILYHKFKNATTLSHPLSQVWKCNNSFSSFITSLKMQQLFLILYHKFKMQQLFLILYHKFENATTLSHPVSQV